MKYLTHTLEPTQLILFTTAPTTQQLEGNHALLQMLRKESKSGQMHDLARVPK